VSDVAECFLCSPDAKLIYFTNGAGFALCGLGPILPRYSLVASHDHIHSAADLDTSEMAGFVALTSRVRDKLAALHGSCLLTEHGRLPVCVAPGTSVGTDPHCYHAHFLLFPDAPEVEQQARRYFRRIEEASVLSDALVAARAHEEYFLCSPHPNRFLIMSRPGKLIRQFARLLVAESLGKPELANWRRHPDYDVAVTNSANLRGVFGPEENEP
jgi:hypothetical protein